MNQISDFSGMDWSRLSTFSSSCRAFSKSNRFDVKKGGNIFFNGDEYAFVFQILDGVVRTSKTLPDGSRVILSFSYPGDIVGLSDKPTHCSDCDAITNATLRIYTKATFYNLVQNDPDFCRLFLKFTTKEISRMQDHFVMISKKSAPERLALFLCDTMERERITAGDPIKLSLPMKRSDIADFLGLTMETVCRQLSRLRREGAIEFAKSKLITVLQPKKLKAIAENQI